MKKLNYAAENNDALTRMVYAAGNKHKNKRVDAWI